ncbi:VanW family protein [Brassicibacter mesophilus]|uniref:VanW family protein n=1 Tax=Brassicibacter mesophilus TaxID=745119 RepID=UPI003D1BAC76
MKYLKEYSFKKVIIAIIIGMILTLLLFLFFVLNTTSIHKGVAINGVSVSGKNAIEASKYLENRFQKQLMDRRINLKYKDYILAVKYEDIGVKYDYYLASKKAYQIGREGNIRERLKSILSAKIYGKDINMEIIYDNRKISSIIDIVKYGVNDESKDAEIRIVNDKPAITREVIGKKVQEDALKERIVNSLMYSDIVEIPVIEDIPRLTKATLSKITSKIGSFSSSFKGSTAGRIHNINLASKSIDGRIILSGETFSFNNTTGSRDADAGYKESIVIVDGDYTSGVGGGVCQVSTTLYNALLLSNIEIVERHPHSIPASYVKHGRDAAVAYNYLDLKFRNSLDVPIYLRARTSANNLIIDIFSKEDENGKAIKIESDIVEKIEPEIEESIDSLLSPGEKIVVQKGRYGYKVKTYKITYHKGKEIDRELITNDYYKPKKYIIKKGPAIEIDTEEEAENGGTIQ